MHHWVPPQPRAHHQHVQPLQHGDDGVRSLLHCLVRGLLRFRGPLHFLVRDLLRFRVLVRFLVRLWVGAGGRLPHQRVHHQVRAIRLDYRGSGRRADDMGLLLGFWFPGKGGRGRLYG